MPANASGDLPFLLPEVEKTMGRIKRGGMKPSFSVSDDSGTMSFLLRTKIWDAHCMRPSQ